MNKEELISFLKENMRIELNTYYRMYAETPSMSVTLFIGDEKICKDSITLHSSDIA